MISWWDVLKASKGLPVSDFYAAMWGEQIAGKDTIAELEGELPLTFNANGEALIDYRIYGNTVQTGTPTPENPIMPEGVGERTENLFDKDNTEGIENNRYIDRTTGNKVIDVNYYISAPIAVTSEETYYWTFCITSGGAVHGAPTVGFFDTNDNQIGVAHHDARIKSFSFTTPANCAYIRASVYKHDINEEMLTEGSTAPAEYIPYGYKLPLTSAGQNVDIYLGEVPTTRRIKKLVLTGEENWRKRTYGDANYTYEHAPGFGIEAGLCSHYARLSAQNIDKVDGAYLERTAAIIITDLRFTTTTDFKAFLAAQYANGTPVTVWCAIATEETGIVNEPLMKIGDYADTLSMEQAGVSIPTNKGSTTLDVDTTIKPSNVYIKYKS